MVAVAGIAEVAEGVGLSLVVGQVAFWVAELPGALQMRLHQALTELPAEERLTSSAGGVALPWLPGLEVLSEFLGQPLPELVEGMLAQLQFAERAPPLVELLGGEVPSPPT